MGARVEFAAGLTRSAVGGVARHLPRCVIVVAWLATTGAAHAGAATEAGTATGDLTPRVIRVGANGEVALPSEAARIARNGDTVEIEAGLYPRDTAVWTQDNLVIRGVGGTAHLDATDTKLVQEKAIWVFKGNNTRVENMEFSNARSPDRNGAGIRQEGAGLTASHCYFHDNEEGILAGKNTDSDIVVEYSEFARNGHEDGQAHNLYIGEVRSFELRFSYVHHANTGSNVKSRAHLNKILYNRIMDEVDGRGNYKIDLSNGGQAFIIGNLIQQGRHTENYHMIAFATEGAANPRQELYVLNNTMVNDRHNGRFVLNKTRVPARLYNNIFIGAGEVIVGPGVLVGNVLAQNLGGRRLANAVLRNDDDTFGGVPGSHRNVRVESAGLRALMGYDYRLNAGSPAIDVGVVIEEVDGFPLMPKYEYVHPLGTVERLIDGDLDAGAYEYRAASP